MDSVVAPNTRQYQICIAYPLAEREASGTTGIDEVEWRIHERRQAGALADEGRGGRCDLALALMAAFEAPQAAAGGAGLTV